MNFKYLRLFIFLAPFVSLSLLCASHPAQASSISTVQVTGKDLQAFLGHEISQMNLQVYRGGKWQALPYQIDEKAFDPIARGRRWVLDQAFSRRTDLPAGNGKLEEDEVLLFLLKDMGEKGSPESSTDRPVLEIKSGGGYAYLFLNPKNPLVSQESYVRYNPNEDEIDALGYKNRFNTHQAIVQEELVPKNQKSGSPANILDRFKVRMMLAIKNFIDVNIDESNLTSKKVGYRVGPIRIIRRMAVYKSLGPIRITPKAESDFLFYPYFVRVPSRLDNPIDGRKSLESNSKGFAGFDFTHFFYGARFFSEKNPRPVLIDGAMSAEEKGLNLKDVTWWTATSEKGTLIVKVQWDPNLVKEGVTCNLYYVDDRTSLKPPEMDPGEAAVGFQLDFTQIPAGQYSVYVNQIFPPGPFQMGTEGTYINQIQPPAVSVTPVS